MTLLQCQMPPPSVGNMGEKNHMPLLVSHFNVMGSGEMNVGNRVMGGKME